MNRLITNIVFYLDILRTNILNVHELKQGGNINILNSQFAWFG